MIAQIIHLSSKEVFQKYSGIINSSLFSYEPSGYLLELREAAEEEITLLKNFIQEDKKIFFNKDDSSNKFFVSGSISEIKNIFHNFPKNGLRNEVDRLIQNYLNYNSIFYSIGNKEFNFHETYVMGVLNVTPDSFSDGGLYINTDDAVEHALEMLNDGADIIDIGGESTRPGSEIVSEDEELERVVPVIKKVLLSQPAAVISIDTTKSKVADEALRNGAKIVNDISAATFDDEMLSVVKKYDASVVLMHIKGTPKTMQHNPFYDNVIEEIYDFLFERIKAAENSGIEKIFIRSGNRFREKNRG